jgi:hypothetical protein
MTAVASADRAHRRQAEMAAHPGPGEHRVQGQHSQVDDRDPTRPADALQEVTGRREHELERIGQCHGANDRGAALDQFRRDAGGADHRPRPGEQNRHRRAAEQEGKQQSAAQIFAGLRQIVAAIGARREHQHARHRRQPHDDRDEGQRPPCRQRAELAGAGMADHGDVDQVHQRPVEAGQHDRPRQAQDAARLGDDLFRVEAHGGVR